MLFKAKNLDINEYLLCFSVHTNGFIILVLVLKLLQKENGIVQHALPTWHDEKDGNKKLLLNMYIA